VPVALSTDDEGIARIDLTHEYVRAVETFGLTYADLKEIVRNSLEYSFLPGASLWGERGSYAQIVEACRSDAASAETSSQTCAAFLDGSEGRRAMGARVALFPVRGRLLSPKRGEGLT
jgi:adenosine deaminase